MLGWRGGVLAGLLELRVEGLELRVEGLELRVVGMDLNGAHAINVRTCRPTLRGSVVVEGQGHAYLGFQ
jgi:hypothetical protein